MSNPDVCSDCGTVTMVEDWAGSGPNNMHCLTCKKLGPVTLSDHDILATDERWLEAVEREVIANERRTTVELARAEWLQSIGRS